MTKKEKAWSKARVIVTLSGRVIKNNYSLGEHVGLVLVVPAAKGRHEKKN